MTLGEQMIRPRRIPTTALHQRKSLLNLDFTETIYGYKLIYNQKYTAQGKSRFNNFMVPLSIVNKRDHVI